MEAYEKLLLQNKAWATEQVKTDPEYFNRLVNQQTPTFLWIGCSDSRVPADMITGTEPGQLFVHRNIANLVVNTDINLLSVLQYAIEVLNVQHVIVCGHYGCGGVKAAMGNTYYGTMNNWLNEIKDVYRQHKTAIDLLPEADRLNRLVELNVEEQVFNLSKTAIIQKAWKEKKFPHLHGWVYGLHDGLIKPVTEMRADTNMHHIYMYDNL